MYAKTPSVFQMEMTECGAASLCMILAYHGCWVPLEEMRVESGVSRDGCNMKGIKRAAGRFGLEARAFRKKAEELKRMQVPCIIHWNFNHFVVFEGFRGRYAIINDPAFGRRRLSMAELSEGFTGIVMTFKTTEKFRRSKKKPSMLRFCRDRLQGEYGALLRLLLAGSLLVLPGIALPLLSQVFIDEIVVRGHADAMAALLLFMGVCVALRAVLGCYRGQVLKKLKARMTLTSGRDLLKTMLQLPIGFFDQRYVGDLVSRVMDNALISEFLAGDLTEIALSFLLAVIDLAILLLYSPLLTLVGSLKIAVCLISFALGRRTLQSAAMKLQMDRGKLHGALAAGLSLTDSIKAAGVETEYCSRILDNQAAYVRSERALMKRQQILLAIPEAGGKLIDVLLLLFGGALVIRGRMTIGMLAAYKAFYDAFCDPLDRLLAFFGGYQTMRSGMERIGDIEKHPNSPLFAEHGETALPAGKLYGNIELKDISFGYSLIQPPMLDHLNLSVLSGEMIAIVGASGSGKSTVSKIISGLYRPWSGEIRFDHVPVEAIPRPVFCNSVATVSQEIHLFSGTIRDNLTMWDSTIPQEDMAQAARDACIEEFILRQQGGYDFRLSEEARNISGGERQRLEIARALAKKPSILILDEATSALDPITEKQILDHIRRRACTCIMVTHRLSAIRNCSQILVMRDGQIAQRGTHESLMKSSDLYASLMRQEG